MNECIFCKIANKQIPATIVYEEQNFIAFLDIAPLSTGMIQVIPKQHYRWVWEVQNIGEYFETVQKIALAIKKACKIDCVLSVVYGEEIPHAHVWLVPQYPEENPVRFGPRGKPTKEAMEQVAERIKQQII